MVFSTSIQPLQIVMKLCLLSTAWCILRFNQSHQLVPSQEAGVSSISSKQWECVRLETCWATFLSIEEGSGLCHSHLVGVWHPTGMERLVLLGMLEHMLICLCDCTSVVQKMTTSLHTSSNDIVCLPS